MSLRQFVVAGLAFLGGAHAASSCCFVVQDEAHEVYWSEYATETYTTAVNLTSITTLLTPYPTTTLTNYETNVYLISKVFTTSFLVTDNPVSLYTNPAYAVPQKTEILAGSVPTVTGGVTVNSPTGFWVYSTAKVFVAPAVTDSDGNVACGTLSSFSSVAANATACVPTFTAINSNAAANFDTNGGPGIEISLTTPFIHVPTRTDLQVSPSEVCAQGNGTENYGYPVQQLINHLAGNSFYSAQYPGIESCIPAGPSIQAVEALAVPVTVGPLSSSLGADPPPVSVAGDPPSVTAAADPPSVTAAADPPSVTVAADPPSVTAAADPPSVNVSIAAASSSVCIGNCDTTESAGGGLTSSTTIIVTVTAPTSSSASSSVTGTTAAPGSTSTTSVTSTSVPPALPASASTTSSISSGGESPVSGGLLPASSTSTSSVSASMISPLLETSAFASVSGNSTSNATASTTSLSVISNSSTIISSSISASSTVLPSTVGIVLPGSILLPVTSSLPGLTGPLTTISSSTFVIVSNPTTIPLVVETGTPSVSGLTPVTASSVKESVPWMLLVGLSSLVAVGTW